LSLSGISLFLLDVDRSCISWRHRFPPGGCWRVPIPLPSGFDCVPACFFSPSCAGYQRTSGPLLSRSSPFPFFFAAVKTSFGLWYIGNGFLSILLLSVNRPLSSCRSADPRLFFFPLQDEGVPPLFHSARRYSVPPPPPPLPASARQNPRPPAAGGVAARSFAYRPAERDHQPHHRIYCTLFLVVMAGHAGFSRSRRARRSPPFSSGVVSSLFFLAIASFFFIDHRPRFLRRRSLLLFMGA